MAEYEAREKAFKDNIAGTMSAFTVAAVNADSMGKRMAVANLLEVAGADPVAFKQNLTAGSHNFQVDLSLPPVLFHDNRPLIVEKAEVEMNMDVSASQETSVETQSKVEGSASAGWGPVKVSMKASVGVNSSHKRKSDYRASTRCILTMSQGEVPEVVARIMDACADGMSQVMGAYASEISGSGGAEGG